MPSVRVKENESFEMALRRFRRSCEKAGVFSEMRRREHYEKPTEIRKRKAAAARKRQLKKILRASMPRTRKAAAARKRQLKKILRASMPRTATPAAPGATPTTAARPTRGGRGSRS